MRGSVGLAERLGVPSLIIGLTIVAFGTSAPELFVSVEAVLKGAPTLALGNVVGSNIANILLVIGLPALVAPMSCAAPRLTRNVLLMLAITGAFLGLAATGAFAWPQGLILLTILTAFILFNLHQARRNPSAAKDLVDLEEDLAKGLSVWQAVGLVGVGLVGLVIGADLLVGGAVTIARALGVDEAVIGLTLVAIGTSLPELVTALAAALRSHCDVAVGNVIGSNIFNLLAIIGVSSLFGAIPVPPAFFHVDFWVMLAASLALLPICLRRAVVGRPLGAMFLIAYVSYMAWLAQSGQMTGMAVDQAGLLP